MQEVFEGTTKDQITTNYDISETTFYRIKEKIKLQRNPKFDQKGTSWRISYTRCSKSTKNRKLAIRYSRLKD